MLRTGKQLARPPWRRAYSAQSSATNPYPFHNLRAYPFKMSPERAQNLLSIFASCLISKKFIRSMLCFSYPESSFFSPIRPARLQPVYFPGWILDVELQGQLSVRGVDRPTSAQIHYIPGSDHKVLSSACLAPPKPRPETTVPFSNDLLRQHDLDIACIPYSISPFSIFNIINHLSYAEATVIEPDYRFIPSTLKAELFAAYPILLPVYLAQYEAETWSGTQPHTLFIEAYDNKGRFWSEPIAEELDAQKAFVKFIHGLLGFPSQDNRGALNLTLPKSFAGSAEFSFAPHYLATLTHGAFLRKYIDKAMNLPGAPTALAAATVHNFNQLANDPRVREFTPKERNPVTTWLSSGSDAEMFARMFKIMPKPKPGTTVKKSEHDQLDPVLLKKLLDEFQVLQTQRLKSKPHWARTRQERERQNLGARCPERA